MNSQIPIERWSLSESCSGESRALLVSFLARFAFIFSMQAMPPLFPMIIQEFGTSFTMTGTLLWLVAVPGLFISILGGLLIGRYGVRTLLTVGLAISAASSVLSSSSDSFFILQMSRLLLGVGGAVAVVSAATLLFQWFEKGRLGLAMGVFGICMPSGIIVAFNFLGAIGSIYSWRTSILVTAAVNIVALVACLLLTTEKKDRRSGGLSVEPFRNVHIWILGLGWALFNMAALGYTTWGKTIFVKHYGLSMEFSGLLASTIMFGAFAQPLTGHISDMLGRRRSLATVSCALIAVVFLSFPFLSSTYFLPVTLLLGILVAFVTPALYALSGKVLGMNNGALALGVMNAFLNLGIILGPFTLGYVLDSSDSSLLLFLAMALFALCACVLVAIRPSRSNQF